MLFCSSDLTQNGCFWNFSATERYWVSANVIESIFYFAVPVFFMLTGAKLINYQYRYSTAEFFKKRIINTVIPFIAWSLLGMLYDSIYDRSIFDEMSLKYIWNGIAGNEFISIFWFFPPLFCAYLSMPLFAAVPKEKHNTIFAYLAIAGFIINSFVPFLIKVFAIDIVWPLSVEVSAGYLMYILFGVLLSENDIKKSTRYLLYLLAIAGLAMHICGTYHLSIADGEINNTFKGYCNVPCVLYSVGIFVFLKETGNRIMAVEKLKTILSFIAEYAMSIYLMQFVFLDISPTLSFVDIYSLKYRLGAPFIIAAIIIAVAYVIKKIPVLRRIVP